MSREEIIAAIKTTTEELGRVPTLGELVKTGKVTRGSVRRRLISYKAALEACGLERKGPGYAVSERELFLDWAGLVRQLGRLPTGTEFEAYGDHCRKPATRRFGRWLEIPARMAQYARDHGLEQEWRDVLEVVQKHLQEEEVRARKVEEGRRRKMEEEWARKPRLAMEQVLERRHWPGLMKGEPVYGETILGTTLPGADGIELPLLLAPTNEQGVVLLFGAMARKLGFVVLRIQTEYPDCEALREMEPGRWQRTPIEFELESKNFLLHGHALEKCKVIVCWEHNWKECPVEVVELKRAIGTSGHRDIGGSGHLMIERQKPYHG